MDYFSACACGLFGLALGRIAARTALTLIPRALETRRKRKEMQALKQCVTKIAPQR